jgi:hypothetical protein
MVANRSFKLVDLDLSPGDVIPEAVWNDLRPRTKSVLVNTKFVIRPDQAPKPQASRQGRKR